MSQKQKVGENSIAVQSGRDTIISPSVTPAQMSEIMDIISKQTSSYALMASELAESRFQSFERKILERFANDKATRAESFQDPDFQYLLEKAQHTYARSGDEDIGAILTDLIAERSKQTSRTRMALTLNSAVEKAAVLTNEEFAALSLCFLLKLTRNFRIISKATFVEYFESYISPLLPNISEQRSCLQYLQSEGCASIERLQNIKVCEIFRRTYPALFFKGVDKQVLIDALPEDKKQFF